MNSAIHDHSHEARILQLECTSTAYHTGLPTPGLPPKSDSKATRIRHIGCGPGNSTEARAARLPGATGSDLDSPVDMIAAACKRLPQFQFEVSDIMSWDAAAWLAWA